MVGSLGPLRTGQHSYWTKEQGKMLLDYYAKEVGVLSWYHGKGAKALGFGPDTRVTTEDLAALFEGRSPSSRAALGQHQDFSQHKHKSIGRNRVRVPGYDLAFHPPKSWSACFVMAEPEERAIMLDALRVSVGEAWNLAEASVPRRRGKGGKELEFGCGKVVACFLHVDDRAGAPSVHVHGLDMQLSLSLKDQSWGRTQGIWLYRLKHTLGAYFRVSLAHQMALQGTALEPIRSEGLFSWDIANFPKPLSRALSPRSAAIRAKMEELGLEGSAGAQTANLLTRKSKQHQSFKQLQDKTWATAEEHGLTRDRLASLLSFSKGQDLAKIKERSIAVIANATRESLYDYSVASKPFERKDLIKSVCNRVQASGCSPHQVLGHIDRALQSDPRVVTHSVKRGRTYYSVKGPMLEPVRMLQAQAREAHSNNKPCSERPKASPEQHSAMVKGEPQGHREATSMSRKVGFIQPLTKSSPHMASEYKEVAAGYVRDHHKRAIPFVSAPPTRVVIADSAQRAVELNAAIQKQMMAKGHLGYWSKVSIDGAVVRSGDQVRLRYSRILREIKPLPAWMRQLKDAVRRDKFSQHAKWSEFGVAKIVRKKIWWAPMLTRRVIEVRLDVDAKQGWARVPRERTVCLSESQAKRCLALGYSITVQDLGSARGVEGCRLEVMFPEKLIETKKGGLDAGRHDKRRTEKVSEKMPAREKEL